MTVAETRSKAVETVQSALGHVPDLVSSARTGAEQVAEHMPEAIERARAGAQGTNTTLQTMPDQTLKLLAAGSVGLAIGLHFAGAPRLLTLAAILPALFVGGAIVTRPGRSADPIA
jgi:2-methylisocitrate lyase-like PEP mutase family enzyme